MARLVSRSALLAAGLLLLAQPAFPAASKKDLAACASSDPAVSVKGCTTVFEKSKGNVHTQAAALYNRGIAYGRQNNVELALKDLNAAYEMIKGNEDKEAKLAYGLHLERGKHYYFGGDYAAAEADFRAAKALNNVEPQAALNLAFALNSQEKFEEADKELFWALALDEKNASALALSGIVSFYLGNYDRAMERTNAALEQSPGMPWALGNRALIYYWQGNASAAMDDLDKVIAAEPTNAWALALRARIHTERNEVADARTAIDAALAADAKSARAHFTNGLVLAAEKKPVDAQKEFDAAYALDKTLTEALIESGKLAETQNDPQAALRWYDQAIAAPTPSDQDKVRQEKTKALKQALQEKIDRPGKLQAACNGADAEQALAACDELLAQETNPQARLPLLVTKLKWKKMPETISEVLSIDPKNIEGLMAKGMQLHFGEKRDKAAAAAIYSDVIAIDPKFFKAYVFRAMARDELKDHSGALSDLDAAMAISPTDPQPLALKTAYFLRMRDFSSAIPVAEKWTTVAPDKITAWQQLGMAHIFAKHIPEAQVALAKAEALRSGDPYSRVLESYIALAQGDTAKAIALTTASLLNHASAANAPLLVARARAYVAAGIGPGALADSEEVLKIIPNNPPARSLHAEALLMVGRAAEALKEADAILAEGGPEFPDVRPVKAAAQIQTGAAEAAMATINDLLQASPSDAKFISLRSSANLALGKTDAGLADLDKASQLMPDNKPLMMERAKLRLGQKQYDEALAALSTAGDTAGIHAMRGEILLAKGDSTKALEALETAVKLDANNIKALKLIGDIYANLGSNDLALQYYGKAVAASAMTEDAALVEEAKAARAKLMESMAKKTGGG